MGKEIEIPYLLMQGNQIFCKNLNSLGYSSLDQLVEDIKRRGNYITQSYLDQQEIPQIVNRFFPGKEPELYTTPRIRQTLQSNGGRNVYELTLKGPDDEEEEREIVQNVYRDFLAKRISWLTKKRISLMHPMDPKVQVDIDLYVDNYDPFLKNLVKAEFESKGGHTKEELRLDLPAIGLDVTEDRHYKNVVLAQKNVNSYKRGHASNS